ncbi:glycosyl transferase family 2 [Sulfurifustis variabilis]|uniref:Glycosyl transferase family 2 n=1 Tax=Sulfurifustis variabilis TaxID=1675686 RepID=A0A1B4V414_9GAMM|nr:glycosyltransferase family A protein [Sulfurifustis variabilis]BAU48278.1 glycosyl transferase family 2 [Sulfurifustis variabilis]
MPRVDVLLPTCDRPLALAMTLSGLAAQRYRDYRLIVADQSEAPALAHPTIASLKRIVETLSAPVAWHRRDERRGIAEQRQFLLEAATAELVLYLDDDVLMEPWVLDALVTALARERCGFVGAFPSGLSFREDVRPDQQRVEFWDGPVRPETVEPGSPAWERRHLHRAANLYHATLKHAPAATRLYKVAWVASCVLYDRAKLLDVGGFAFWPRLPRWHSGEEVLAQNLLMRRYGGAAIMPSGTWHAEEPSTVLNAAGTVDGHALVLLDEMAARFTLLPEKAYG